MIGNQHYDQAIQLVPEMWQKLKTQILYNDLPKILGG
jgi:hypothetical protein